MSNENYPILSSMLDAIDHIDKYHPNGVAVSQPSMLVPRSQILDVYNEGLLFSGIESVGNSESCVAPTPAPHIPAYIPIHKYLNVASEVFGNNAKLYPKYDEVKYLSSQVTLWWRRKNDENPYDFADIYKLDQKEQSNFCIAISNKTIQGIKLATKLRGNPIVWGTWGYGTSDEREKEGYTLVKIIANA